MAGERPLSLGDRIANFLLPDHRGTKRSFYHELRGGPVILVAVRDPGAEAAMQTLYALLAQGERWRALGAQLFTLSPEPWRAAAEGLSGPVGDAFIDPQGQSLLPLLTGGDGSPGEGAVFLLDPNQRLLARAPLGADCEALLGALEVWQAGQSAAAVSVASAAPVLILPNVLDSPFCQRLTALWRGEHHEGGVSTGRINVQVAGAKRTLEHVIEDRDLKRELNSTLARRISPELAKVFHYRAPFVFDIPIVMAYQPTRQDFFGLHRDDLREDRQRRFALSLNLNDDFQGGALHFPEYGPQGYKMAAGTAAVFSVAMLHEARPVTSGTRFVLTSFFCDPPAALQAEGGPRHRSVRL